MSIRPLEKEQIGRTTQVEHLSSELKKVEEEMQSCLAVDFTDVRQRTVNCCPKHDALRFVDQGTETCDVRVDIGSQTDGTEVSPSPMGAATSSITTEDDRDKLISHLQTSYTVDRMASDGRNILYTSFNDHEPHMIVYCLIDKGQSARDEKQAWNLPRVEDLIWWKKLERFVCATRNAIYTVDYRNGKFQILCVARDSWSKIRVAANSNYLFVHAVSRDGKSKEINVIEVYSIDFQLISSHDTTKQKYFSLSQSFCATEHMLVSVRTLSEDGRRVMYINFFDRLMNQLGWFCLGSSSDPIAIRHDGNDYFFVSTGERKLHIVTLDGKYKTITLKDEGDCITVLDNQRIAVSKGRSNIELVTY